MIHTHFQHSHLGILRHSQNRHRHTNIIVVVGWGLTDAEGTLQYRSNHFLRCAFPHRAGDRDHLRPAAFQRFPRNVAQSGTGVLCNDRRIIPNPAAAQHRSSALLHSGRDVIVTIPRPLQSDEQLPRLQASGIIACSEKSHIRIFLFYRSAAPFGGIPQCNLSHTISPIPSGGQLPLPVHPDDTCARRCPDRFHVLFPQGQLYHFFPQCP